jgi:pilus assembly protein CpaC
MILPAWQRRCLASAAAGLVLLVTTAAALQVPAAHATDAEVLDISGAQQPGGRFLRLGLSKSAVIKLPADAKDVIVGDDAIVDVVLRNKKIAYLFARGAGQTNIFFFDGKGQELLHLDLEVTVDSKALKNLLDRSLPGNKIQIDSSGSNVILKGTVASAQDAKTAEDLANRFVNSSSSSRSSFSFFTFSSASTSPGAVLNLLKIAESDQVMLKVRVIELKREIIKRFGINLDANLGAGSLTSTPITPLDELGAGLSNAKIKLNAGGSSIDIQIKALEEQGLAKTLAEPTLTAVSGASANFLAGGEYPYRECEGNDLAVNCQIQFKPYGVSLAFTPTVLAENRIALNIATEVSEIGRQIFGIPSIETRKAQTSVEMPSGGSMMMAGLIKDVTKQDLKGTPGLKSLPVLGALFSSREYESNQTELVVIVTPYIAGPVDTNKLATPVDHYNNPTDLQQIFLGRLNRVYGVSGQTPASVYHGAVGHIVE